MRVDLLCGFDSQIQTRNASELIFAKRIVGIAIEPTLTGLCGSDDGVRSRACVFASVTVRRAIAAERNVACLAGAQMDPVRTNLHALLACAALRLFD
jgi:hypothetical protein